MLYKVLYSAPPCQEYFGKSSQMVLALYKTNSFQKNISKRVKLLTTLRGKSPSTVSAYSRAVRRVSGHFDCCPDRLSQEQLEDYFLQLVESHSWSAVKLDRLGDGNAGKLRRLLQLILHVVLSAACSQGKTNLQMPVLQGHDGDYGLPEIALPAGIVTSFGAVMASTQQGRSVVYGR